MNLIKTKAGTLTVLSSFINKNQKSNTYLNILCFCGNKFVAGKSAIVGVGKTIFSCGCYQKKMRKIINLKHHHAKRGNITPTYYAWCRIKQWCMNKNHKNYPTTGGRGISICDDWMVFENFLKDMGEKPIGFRLNRKDKDGDFDIENCEWVPKNKKLQKKKKTQKFYKNEMEIGDRLHSLQNVGT